MTRLKLFPQAGQPNASDRSIRPDLSRGVRDSRTAERSDIHQCSHQDYQQSEQASSDIEHQVSSPLLPLGAVPLQTLLMDYEILSSPDNSGTPDSSHDTGGYGAMMGHMVPFEARTPGSGHSVIPTPPVESPSQPYNHSRAYSDPELPFQNFAVSEQWQRDFGISPTDQFGRHTQGSSSSHQFWNQPHNQPLEAGFSEMMLPRDLHHIYDLNAPWSFFEEPPRSPMQELFGGDGGESKLQNVSNYGQPGWQPTDLGRSGKRNGPLSNETRQNANDVREVGSCLRCSVMRELCDTGYPCRNCSQKEARSWKFGKFCVRPRLAQRAKYLTPAALIDRLQKEYVFHFIAHRGWRRGEAWFALPLDIGLGDRLDLPVREYLPFITDSQYRPAYLNEPTIDGPRAKEVYEYDLPVVIYCYDEKHVARHIRGRLSEWFHKTLQTLNSDESRWAWHWFDEPKEEFLAEIMSLICKYYRADLPTQHIILLRALGLSFFNYIFNHSFEVPLSELPEILKKMANGPEVQMHNLRWVAPSAINKYIKMNLAPAMGDVASRILRGLEKLLLDTQNRTTWRRDIVFAAAFIIVAHLGKTQASLIQLAAQPEPNENSPVPPFSREEAESQAVAIEGECINILILYLKQFMVPSARRKQYNTAAAKKAGAADTGAEEAEEHAKSFGLIQQIIQLRDRYAHTRPANLEIHKGDISSFMARNTYRVCWKFIDAVLADIG